MDLKYTKFEPAKDIEAYAVKRFATLTHFLKSFEKTHEITLFVEIARTTRHHRKGDVFYAEAMFEATPGGKKFRASSTGSDIRGAIDEVKEKLKKEIRRTKDKLVSSRTRPRSL